MSSSSLSLVVFNVVFNNNLKLNVDKSKEMIIKRPRTRSAAPPPLLGIERVESMNILGVIFQCNLSFTMQVDRLVVRGAQTMYALGTLTAPRVKWSTTVGGHPSHFHSQADICVSSVVGSTRRPGPRQTGEGTEQGCQGLPKLHPPFAQICDSADEQMFGDILKNPKHCPPSSVTTSQ